MVYIEKEACVNCGTCMRLCPMGVFTRGETGIEIHPHRRCIQCMHCAGACPRKAIRFEELPEEAVYPQLTGEPLEELIQSRRSIRHFSDRLPEKTAVQHALDVAAYAPSGKNQRAFRYAIVWGKNKVEELRDRCMALCREYGEAPELPKLLAKGTDLLTCGAPCMIVVHSPDDCLNLLGRLPPSGQRPVSGDPQLSEGAGGQPCAVRPDGGLCQGREISQSRVAAQGRCPVAGGMNDGTNCDTGTEVSAF